MNEACLVILNKWHAPVQKVCEVYQPEQWNTGVIHTINPEEVTRLKDSIAEAEKVLQVELNLGLTQAGQLAADLKGIIEDGGSSEWDAMTVYEAIQDVKMSALPDFTQAVSRCGCPRMRKPVSSVGQPMRG